MEKIPNTTLKIKENLMEITNHHELRRRVSIDCSKPVLTDQSYKNYSDINNIMLQYSKTGLLPVAQNKVAQYIDNTEIPSLEKAHELIRDARELFLQLPAQVRKLMNNDPTQLASFVKDPENEDVLVKYGIISPPKVAESPLKGESVTKAARLQTEAEGESSTSPKGTSRNE